MLDYEPLNWWKLGHAVFRLLDGSPSSPGRVLMAVPLGFPIVEASYGIREQIPQDIGLIRRYVLDGVCRFGPCTSAELDDLLGLGTDVVEQTLVELSNCVPGLTREHDKFRASSEANRTLTNKEFAKTVLQPRKFIVNGLGDDLLPIDFWRHHEEWRLYPNPEHPAGAFCDAAGQASEITVKIRDRMGCGRENLLQLINAKDSIARDRAGIPRGAFGMIDEPESIEVAWVTSFLLVADDGLFPSYRRPSNLCRCLTPSLPGRTTSSGFAKG